MSIKAIHVVILAATCAAAGCTSQTSRSPLGATSESNITSESASGKAPAGEIVMFGLVSGLSGACPTRNFVIGSALVHTDAGTVYTAGSCEALVFSQRVTVTGALKGQALFASQILQQKNKDKP